MLLANARVRHFRSIDDSGEVAIDPSVTVLVGQNESGKTAFLNALDLCRSVRKNGGFSIDRDYPRKAVNEYRRQHESKPANAVKLTYELTESEVRAINTHLGMSLFADLRFSAEHHYKNGCYILTDIDEVPYLKHLVAHSNLPAELQQEAQRVPGLRALIDYLSGQDLNAEGKEFLTTLTNRFKPAIHAWPGLLAYEVWTSFLSHWVPRFFYFDDYYLLPGKVNLKSLSQRVGIPAQQTGEDQTALSLLRLAEVDVSELTSAKGYEEIKSRLEGLSNSITDKVFEYWTQNRELDVEFDIRPDPNDQPPFNDGPNLYVRIRNRRHRVTVPFSQRSKGFIWFFSFIVWFDTIRQQLGKGEDLILLLDEPGLSLHALAQHDFLRYIDVLAKQHQILYTTHSPFMVHSDRLDQVRLVEDRIEAGTVVTSNLSGSDPKTVFPLQAALGYTVAQNLFISSRNLLVEGPGDLVYLRFFSAALEKQGRTGLREDVTIVPAGGLDKVATFIALLGANQLELAVLHDWASRPDPRLDTLVRDRLIKDKLVLNYGLFRNAGGGKTAAKGIPAPAPATDVEDLLSPAFYLRLFNATFATGLGGREVNLADLPPGDRIVERITRYLGDTGIQLRPSGGVNHYAVANQLASSPSRTVEKDTLTRFEELFKKVNSLFTPPAA